MTTVTLHPIPPLWGESFCAFEDCLATATQTICTEPLRCTSELCRQYVACDEHAGTMAALVERMLTCPPDSVEPVPPEGEFGGHD